MGECFAREQENADRRRGRNQPRKLRPAARLRGDRRRRRACIDRKGADETSKGVGHPDPDEIPVDVRAFRAIGERPRRCRRLHHHHQRNQNRDRRDDVNVVPGNRGQQEMRRCASDRPERRHAFGFETERNRRQPSEAKANESPGKPWANAFAHKHDRKHAKADRQRPGIGRWSARNEGQGLLNKRTVIWFDAEHRGRLQNENMAGDAEEKARRHRNGQKVSDEAEPEDAGANENEPDCKAERRRGCRIMLWPRRREHRKRAGENRRDGRIGADRKAPAVAKKREPDRGGDKSKQTDLRREVGEARGRHLRGNCDRGKCQTGDHVGAEVARTPAVERPQKEPGAPSAKRRGGIFFA